MLIVDAQIHLWNAGKPTSPWHRQIPAYPKDDALKEMDAGGVDAAILTPHTPWDPNANELCMEAVRAHPDRFAILGNFALDQPESRALVDTWKQRPGMLGCRFTFIGPQQEKWPTDVTVDWLWPAAERAGLPIAMMAANFLPKVAEIAQRHPRLKLILDHLGRPEGRHEPERAVVESAGRARAREVSQRRDEGDRRAELLRSALPVSRHPRQPAPPLRCLRASALVLGYRHHAHALPVAPVRHAVHGRAALAEEPRPRAGHGPGYLRLAGLETMRGLGN